MKFRVLLAVLVYFLAANVPLWIGSIFLGLSIPGLFNLEFIAVGALSFFVSKRTTVCLLFAAVALDLLNCVGGTYLFSFSEMVLAAPSAFTFAPSHLWSLAVAGCMAGICLAAAIIHRCVDGRERWYAVAALTAVAALFLVVDGARGQLCAWRTDFRRGELRLTRNSLHPLAMSAEREWVARHGVPPPAIPIAGASAKLAALDRDGRMAGPMRPGAVLPNVVFVLVESWGEHLSRDVDEALALPYLRSELGGRYTISRGIVPFHGATVGGEMRELCGSTLGLGVLNASAEELRGCQAAKFGRMGYRTVAVHGFASKMFEREAWYSKMGFEETWFRDKLDEIGLPQCPGPFPGVCDAALAEWIGDRMQKDSGSPQFIYWVTLNSHLPVPVPNGVKDPPFCGEISGLGDDEAMCSWYQLIFNVHRSVSELAAKAAARPTIFVIAGDHAPPFSSARLRQQFSDTVVPYIILWPKSGSQDNALPDRSIARTARPLDKTRRSAAKQDKKISRGSDSGD